MALTLFKLNDIGTQRKSGAYSSHSCMYINILLAVVEVYCIVGATS